MSRSPLRQRLIDHLQSWFDKHDPRGRFMSSRTNGWTSPCPRGGLLGMVRRGQGVRIAAGVGPHVLHRRACAGGVPQALCLCPAGLELRQEVDHLTARQFELLLAQPIEIPVVCVQPAVDR